MDGNSCVGLQVLSVECGKHSNVLLRATRASDDTVVSIDHLDEVSSSEMNTLNSENLNKRNKLGSDFDNQVSATALLELQIKL